MNIESYAPFATVNLVPAQPSNEATEDTRITNAVTFTQVEVEEGKPEQDARFLFLNVEIQHDLAILKNITGVRVLPDRTYILDPEFKPKMLSDVELAALTRVLFGVLYQADGPLLKTPALFSARLQELTDRLSIDQVSHMEVIVQALLDRHHELFLVSAPRELNTPEMRFHMARVPELITGFLADIVSRKDNRLATEIGQPVSDYLEAELLQWESVSSNLEELARVVANSLNGLREITKEKSCSAIKESQRALSAFRSRHRYRLQRLRVAGVTVFNFLEIRHATYLHGDLAGQTVIESAIHRRLKNMVRYAGNPKEGLWKDAYQRDSRIHRLFSDLEKMQDSVAQMKKRKTPLDIEAMDITRVAIKDTWTELYSIWDQYSSRIRKDLEEGDVGYYGLIRRYAALATAAARAERLEDIYFSVPEPIRFWNDGALSALLFDDIAFQNKQIQMRHDHIRTILDRVHELPGVHLLDYRVSALEELKDALKHLPDNVKCFVDNWDLHFAAAKSLRRVRKLSRRYDCNPAIKSANLRTLAHKRETGMLSQDQRISDRWKERIATWRNAWK